MIYLNTVVEKIHRENKYCLILGDFNLDLLKFESNPGTNEFLRTILQESEAKLEMKNFNPPPIFVWEARWPHG